MKIEIDLNDILGDETGAETLQDSIKRQVIEKFTREIKAGISKRIDTEISAAINKSLKENVEKITPDLIQELMNSEYTRVDQWGDRTRKTTTFRKELVRSINENMVYQAGSGGYDGKNAFSKAVDGVIENNLDEFKKDFKKVVDDKYLAETMAFAVATLQKRLGLK